MTSMLLVGPSITPTTTRRHGTKTPTSGWLSPDWVVQGTTTGATRHCLGRHTELTPVHPSLTAH
eukprot:1724072-Prorocentrum_lima.AAC.1